MPPSGKIAGPFSVALSAAAVLCVIALIAFQSPLWPQAAHELGARFSAIWFRPDAASETAKEDMAGAPRVPVATADGDKAEAEKPTEAAFLVPPLSWTHQQIEQALMECLSAIAPLNAEIIPLAPLAYGGCGTPAPVLLRSLGGKDKVTFDPPLLVNCPLVASLSRWLEGKVQPAARADLGSPVARIMASSYACRTPYNRPSERLSQHAFANAIDLPVFVLADGRAISVTKGWGPAKRDPLPPAPKLLPVVAKPSDPARADDTGEAPRAGGSKEQPHTAMVVKASATPELDLKEPVPAKPPLPAPDLTQTPQAKFLRQVHRGACETFSTVLGPEANDVHRTHLHLDLQERNASKVCQ